MSSPLAAFKGALASAVIESQGLSSPAPDVLARQINVPDPEHGDLALPCFLLAKAMGGDNPPTVAQRICLSLSSDPRFSEVSAAGPYVNVRLAPSLLAETVLDAARDDTFGESRAGQGRTVVIDYSSPNIAKPLAFHHIRSTVLGHALGRLHQAQGWTVRRINYLGDWGKQFGILATGFGRHGDPDRRADAKHLVEVYVRANAEADVASRKAAIAAPDEARRLAEALAKAQADVAEAPSKKLEKTVKSLEKKLRSVSKMGSEGLEPALAQLKEDAQKAEAGLPKAERRDAEAKAFLRDMEAGRPEALAEWQAFRETSVLEFQRVYARMGVEFDAIEGESFYSDVLEDTLNKVRAQPGTRLDEGAEVVDLNQKPGQPPVLLKTRDGTTLYITRDIAAALDRYERFRFDRALYVVGADQSLHFEQLFKTLSAMGFSAAAALHHVPFGRVSGMSTRRGQIVFLDEVLDEAVSKARAISEASDRIDAKHFDEAVEAIGIGAVMFGDLKNPRVSDYNFDWDDVLDFRGFTAPYVQFAHARTCSILRKGGGPPSGPIEGARLSLREERQVLSKLAGYPDTVAAACEAFEPSLVTRYVLELAQTTAAWLTAGNQEREKRVLHETDETLKRARLALVDAVRRTLRHGLFLLGVRAPEAM